MKETNTEENKIAAELHQINNSIKKSSSIVSGPTAKILMAAALIGICSFAGAYTGVRVSGGGKSASAGFVDPDKIFSGRAISQNEVLYGKADAKVVFLNYSDTECPYCKAFHEDGFKKLRESYKNSKDVAIVYRHFPLSFHTLAPKESEAAFCVRDQLGVTGYEAFLDSVYTNTKSNNGLDPSMLPKLASAIAGINADTFNSCLSTGKFTQQVADDTADGVAAGVTGTPHSIVMIKTDNGYQILARIEGARDFNYIDKVLKQAISMTK